MLTTIRAFCFVALLSLALPARGQTYPITPTKITPKIYVADFQRIGTDNSDLAGFAQRLFELRLDEIHLVDIASSSSLPCGILQGHLPQSSSVTAEPRTDSGASPSTVPPFYLVQGSVDIEKDENSSQTSSLLTYDLTYFVDCQSHLVLRNKKGFRASDALQSLLDAADEIRSALAANVEQRASVAVGTFTTIGDESDSFRAGELLPRIVGQKLAETEDLVLWNDAGGPASNPSPVYKLRGRVTISKLAPNKLSVKMEFFVNDEPLPTSFSQQTVGSTLDDLIPVYVDACSAAVKALSDLHYSQRADISPKGSEDYTALTDKARHLLCHDGDATIPNCTPDPQAALVALTLASRKSPGDTIELSELIAQAHYAAGEFLAAARTYDSALETLGQDSSQRRKLLRGAADAWFEAGDYARAVDRYKGCLRLGPSSPSQGFEADLRLKYVRTLKLANRNQEALDELLTDLLAVHESPANGTSSIALAGALTDELEELIQSLPHEELQTADKKIQAHLAFDSVLQASALSQIGMRYFANGEFDQAEPLLSEALRLRTNASGISEKDRFDSLTNLGATYSKLKRYSEAQSALSQALDLGRAIFAATDQELADADYRLASVYYYLSKYDLAETLYTAALEIIQVSGQPNSIANVLTQRGFTYSHAGKYALAESDLQRALEVRQKSSTPDASQLSHSMENLADVYLEQGKYTKAEPLFTKQLTMDEALAGNNTLQVKRDLNNLGRLYTDSGRLQESLALLTRAKEINDPTNADPEISDSVLINLGILLFYRGQYRDAEPLQRESLELAKKAGFEADEETAQNNLGLLYIAQMRYEEADTVLTKALLMARQEAASQLYLQMAPIKNLAELRRKQGRYVESERLYKQAMKLLSDLGMNNSPDYAVNLNGLGLLYTAERRYQEAEVLCKKALSLREKELGHDHWRIVSSVLALGDLSLHQGRLDDAEGYYNRAIKIWNSAQTPGHPDVAASQNGLAKIRSQQHKFSEAERLCLAGLATRRQVFGSHHRDVADSLATLASIYVAEAKYDQAISLYEEALSIYTTALGSGNPEAYSILVSYAVALRKVNRIPEADHSEKQLQGILEEHPEIKLDTK
jgi:tetratricopeptide (TPR) repeat protein